MTKKFEGFSREAVQFLVDLKANNNREWFAEHKQVYETEIKKPAGVFCAEMRDELQRMSGMEHSSKIFRIHRDVRFSKDKTPYKAHLHILFAPLEDSAGLPVSPPRWFFGLMPDHVTFGAGVFSFEKSALETYRARIAGADGEALAKLLAGLKKSGMRLPEAQLKRVPAGFDKDHPRGALLRRKGLAVWKDLDGVDAVSGPGTTSTCVGELKRLKPVFDWLMG